MPLLRLVFVLLIVAVLTLFTLQNWSASLQLMFLGVRSPALPLPLWILSALAAGAATSVVISILFRLTRFTAQRSVRRPTEQRPDPIYRAPSRESAAAARPPRQAAKESDWDEDASDWFDDDGSDWTDEGRPKPRTDFETPNRQPQSGSRSGSSYSYTYREPRDVVDADFRVIRPPQKNLDDDDSE
jgi:hypothetical protein